VPYPLALIRTLLAGDEVPGRDAYEVPGGQEKGGTRLGAPFLTLLRAAVSEPWAAETRRIVDRRDNGNPWQLRAGDRAPSDWETRTLPSGLRIGPPGRILSVR
jgi:hypothetical protein